MLPAADIRNCRAWKLGLLFEKNSSITASSGFKDNLPVFGWTSYIANQNLVLIASNVEHWLFGIIELNIADVVLFPWAPGHCVNLFICLEYFWRASFLDRSSMPSILASVIFWVIRSVFTAGMIWTLCWLPCWWACLDGGGWCVYCLTAKVLRLKIHAVNVAGAGVEWCRNHLIVMTIEFTE